MNQDKNRWVNAIQSLCKEPGVKDLRLELKSPQFTYYQWVVGAEHQKNFKSVVLKRCDATDPAPDLSCEWIKPCPTGDKKKGWDYRVKLKPEELARLLNSLPKG